MKKSWNIFRVIIAMTLTLCITNSFYPQKDISDSELADLLKDIEKMVVEMEQEQKESPNTPDIEKKKPSHVTEISKTAVVEKKIEHKDPRANFLESFQSPAKPSTRLGEKKEDIVLPSFKREALEAYFSAFLINLLDVRKKASSVDIYRRTKTFSHYVDQLNELEAVMWEILNSSAYHIPLFSNQFSSLRSHILQAGKELERSNRALMMPETQDVVIATREEFERLRPEKATEKIELKKLTKLFARHLKSLIDDFKKVVTTAGKDIEDIKKKYEAEGRTAERNRKDLESRASRYRPSEFSGQSFWDSPSSRYGEDFDDAFIPGGPGFHEDGMFPFGEGDQGLFPGAGEDEYETGLPAEGDPEKIKDEEKERLMESRENNQKSNFIREIELKKGIISLADQALLALGTDDKSSDKQKTVAHEFIEAIKQHMSELSFIQASLHENRKKNKEWVELDSNYQKALQIFKNVSEKIGISKEDTEDFLRQTRSMGQQEKEASQKLDKNIQKAVDELKKNNNIENLNFIAKTILEHNDKDDKNIFQLSKREAQLLQLLLIIDKKENDLDHVLAEIPLILPHMKAVKGILSRKEQESKKLNLLIEKIEAIEDIVKKQMLETFEKPIKEI